MSPAAAGAAGADLSLTATGNPQPVEAGQDVTHRFVVRNDSGEPANHVFFADVLPDGTEYVSTSCGEPGERSVHCDLGSVQPGETVTVTIVLKTLRPAAIEHRGDVFDWGTDDPDPGDNAAFARSTVNAPFVPKRCGGPRTPPLRGTARSETLTALNGGQKVIGGAGNDRLRGGPGWDCLYGERGNDRISGGPGYDRLYGAAGDDRLSAADGERDVVSCGSGRDYAVVDAVDRVGSDCERVRAR